MLLAYFDESGDAGYINSPTASFTLAAVLVNDTAWLKMLDILIEHRRMLRAEYKIRFSDEIKANHLVHGKGAVKHLPTPTRRRIYRDFMKLQAQHARSVRTFATVIDKKKIEFPERVNPRDQAWKHAIQRLERAGTHQRELVKVFPDEGYGDFIRRIIRQMRRFSHVPSQFGDGSLKRDAENIVEDPSLRKSEESLFVQLADLNAYAAARHVHPHRQFDGSMWDELADARDLRTNKEVGGPPGISVWPR